VPEYLRSGKFLPRAATPTLSNAMDVGSQTIFRDYSIFAAAGSSMCSAKSGGTAPPTKKNDRRDEIFARNDLDISPIPTPLSESSDGKRIAATTRARARVSF